MQTEPAPVRLHVYYLLLLAIAALIPFPVFFLASAFYGDYIYVGILTLLLHFYLRNNKGTSLSAAEKLSIGVVAVYPLMAYIDVALFTGDVLNLPSTTIGWTYIHRLSFAAILLPMSYSVGSLLCAQKIKKNPAFPAWLALGLSVAGLGLLLLVWEVLGKPNFAGAPGLYT